MPQQLSTCCFLVSGTRSYFKFSGVELIFFLLSTSFITTVLSRSHRIVLVLLAKFSLSCVISLLIIIIILIVL